MKSGRKYYNVKAVPRRGGFYVVFKSGKMITLAGNDIESVEIKKVQWERPTVGKKKKVSGKNGGQAGKNGGQAGKNDGQAGNKELGQAAKKKGDPRADNKEKSLVPKREDLRKVTGRHAPMALHSNKKPFEERDLDDSHPSPAKDQTFTLTLGLSYGGGEFTPFTSDALRHIRTTMDISQQLSDRKATHGFFGPEKKGITRGRFNLNYRSRFFLLNGIFLAGWGKPAYRAFQLIQAPTASQATIVAGDSRGLSDERFSLLVGFEVLRRSSVRSDLFIGYRRERMISPFEARTLNSYGDAGFNQISTGILLAMDRHDNYRIAGPQVGLELAFFSAALYSFHIRTDFYRIKGDWNSRNESSGVTNQGTIEWIFGEYSMPLILNGTEVALIMKSALSDNFIFFVRASWNRSTVSLQDLLYRFYGLYRYDYIGEPVTSPLPRLIEPLLREEKGIRSEERRLMFGVERVFQL